jgi:hypothetical protein
VQQDFAVPAALWSEFVRHAAVLVVVAALVSLAAWTAGRRSLPRWTVPESLVMGALILAAGLWVLRGQTLDRFWRVEVAGGELRLYLRDPEPLAWPVAAVTDVRYAFLGKLQQGPCRLVVEVGGTQRFTSAEQRMTLSECQALRAQLLASIGR